MIDEEQIQNSIDCADETNTLDIEAVTTAAVREVEFSPATEEVRARVPFADDRVAIERIMAACWAAGFECGVYAGRNEVRV